MKILDLLRLPSPRFPSDLATDDPMLDDYLRELDRHCLGSASVRRIYVNEIRDNLLEARAQAISEGLSAEAAAEQALADFGPAQALAANQRQGRWRDFFRGGFGMGLAFAVLMLIFSLLSGGLDTMGPLMLVGLFVYYGAFFGLLMGLWYAFMFAPASPKPGSEGSEPASGFEVYSPPISRASAGVMMVVMSVMSVAAVIGALGMGFMAEVGVVANVFLILIALHVALSMRVAFIRIQADDEMLYYRGLRAEYRIPFKAIKGFRKALWWERVLMPIAGAVYRLHWHGEDGDQALWLGLNHEMVNADRLRALLATAGEERGLTGQSNESPSD